MILYLDPFMGIAGDMTVSALVDAGADPAAVNGALAGLGIGDLAFRFEEARRQGLRATYGIVSMPVESHHRNLTDILALLRGGSLAPRVREAAERVFQALARAEAAVHGCPVDHVHFHEVGAADAIADIVGACAAWDSLGAPPVECGPLNLGSGFTVMEHGTFPVPPPAVAELVKGVPTFSCGAPMERTTPTGAAIAVTLARRFGTLPAGAIQAVGHGAGTKDSPGVPNVLRVFRIAEAPGEGLVAVVEATLDDMSAEHLGGAVETIRKAGARDVTVTPGQGKKHRPVWVVTVLCGAGEEGRFADLLLEHTTTAGVRFSTWQRRELPRTEVRIETPWGPLRIKRLSLPSGGARLHPEWDDVETLASAAGISPIQMVERLRGLIPQP
jgi:pyridinium-3,5-bisthiocarboxylic acid mononucleotide nickel chelatase